jgi:hypothetical protein
MQSEEDYYYAFGKYPISSSWRLYIAIHKYWAAYVTDITQALIQLISSC